MTARVLIVDDHEPVRRGIRSLLTPRADCLVCGEAADGVEATELARKLRPDVILMDMSMPRMNGAEATRLIRQEIPEAQVIIVSQNDPVVVRHQAAQIGARGCVSKATLARDLLPAILKIVGGEAEESGENTAEKSAQAPSGDEWLFGGGDLGYLIRGHDWSTTPLGPIPGWPQSLRTAVNLMLNSQHPMWIGWGPEMTFLYNDAYISVLSLAKHPSSLGLPAREVWAEIWNVCGPLAEKVFTKAEASFANDVRLFMSRGEYLEETYYSFSYSPIYDESGKVGGLFCPSTETTAQVLHARRLRTLSELSMRALTGTSIEAACASSVEALSQNPDDVPFCLLYLVDSGENVAILKGTAGVAEGIDPVSPSSIPLASSRMQPWPIREVMEMSQSRLVSAKGVDSLPFGPANQPVTEALVLPVTLPGQVRPAGVLIAAVNPTRKLTREYSTFFSLVADQVASAIQNATATEQERRRAETLAEIGRTNERLRLAQSAANVGTWEWDPADGTTALSPELHRIFGTDPADPKHTERWYSRVDPDDLPRVQRLMGESHHSGEMDFEYRYNSPDLGPRWLLCKGRRLTNETRMFGVVLDITERKKTEQALRDSEERLRAIVETTPECVKVVAPDGTLLHMNGVGLAMVGADCAEAIVGKSIYDLIAPQDRDRFREFNDGVCRGARGSIEFDIVALNGVRRRMETHAAPLRQPDGSFMQLAVTRDITLRKETDRATALLAAIVSSSDDAMVSKNLDGVITSWNQGAERIFGYTAEEAVHQHIRLIIPPDRLHEETDILARLRRGERIDHFETVRRRKDGTLIDVSVTISPVKDAAGRVIGASKVARDVTERKRAEEALRQSEERFRTLSEKLDSEVRARTRELEERNADVLRQSERLRELSWRLLRAQDEERRHIARELHDSAGQTLAVLAMNLSTIVQLTTEKAPELAQSAQETQELAQQLAKEIRTTSYLLHPPLLDENGLPPALSWYVQGLTERSGLDITLHISEGFGRLPRGMELVVFRLVQECLANVHRHSGSKSATIQILREAERILVEVRDHGKGIPPQKLAEIQSGGSGVGIRGMRERLRQFQGEMIIQSTVAGTTVLVTIPISEEKTPLAQGTTPRVEPVL
jgi:PAS domain S-box-containing protein